MKKQTPSIITPRMLGIWETRRQTRENAIQQMVQEIEDMGDGTSTTRIQCMLKYDFTVAPITTNMAQLNEAGIVLHTSDNLTDSEINISLWTAINAMAELGTFFVHTNHLSDKDMYDKLTHEIFLEDIRDLPPKSGADEYIDLLNGQQREPITERDLHLPRPLHPSDK